MKQVIENAYISIDLESSRLNWIQHSVAQSLQALGVTAEIIDQSLHISLAYTDGCCDANQVLSVASKIAKQSFQIRTTGIEILRGQTTPYDYVVLNLAASTDFENAVRVCHRSLPVKNFHGGFRAHVSLFRIPKGMVQDLDQMSELLSQLYTPTKVATVLKGQSVSVFNSRREREIQLRMGRAS